jgi:hypothetical protein
MNKELFDYVTSQLAEGVSPAELKKTLLAAGWQEADVNAALLATQKPPAPAVTLRPTPNPFAPSTQQPSQQPAASVVTQPVQPKVAMSLGSVPPSSASFQGEASYTAARQKIKRKKIGLIVGITGGALLLLGLGIFFFMRQSTPPPVVVAPPPPAVEPPQPVVPPPAPAPLGITLQPGATLGKGTVNRTEIGGKTLLIVSPIQGTSTVQDDGSFVTGVSAEGAQLLAVVDDAGKTRATTVALPQFANMLMFDVSSTAETAVFQTVGILTTNTKDAQDRLEKISTLTCFPKVTGFLRPRLATSSLSDLASDKGYTTLLAQCGAEMTKSKL